MNHTCVLVLMEHLFNMNSSASMETCHLLCYLRCPVCDLKVFNFITMNALYKFCCEKISLNNCHSSLKHVSLLSSLCVL